MDGAAFEKMATAKANRPPRKGHSGDTMLERSFWSSITVSCSALVLPLSYANTLHNIHI